MALTSTLFYTPVKDSSFKSNYPIEDMDLLAQASNNYLKNKLHLMFHCSDYWSATLSTTYEPLVKAVIRTTNFPLTTYNVVRFAVGLLSEDGWWRLRARFVYPDGTALSWVESAALTGLYADMEINVPDNNGYGVIEAQVRRWDGSPGPFEFIEVKAYRSVTDPDPLDPELNVPGVLHPLDINVYETDTALSVESTRQLIRNCNFFHNLVRRPVISYGNVGDPTKGVFDVDAASGVRTVSSEFIYFPRPGFNKVRVFANGFTEGWTSGIGIKARIGFRGGKFVEGTFPYASPQSNLEDYGIQDELEIPSGPGPYFLYLDLEGTGSEGGKVTQLAIWEE